MSFESKTLKSEVRAENYVSSVEHRGPEFVIMDRTQTYLKKSRQIDAFGPMWIVGFANLPTGRVSVRNGNGWMSLSGKKAFFAPAFSVLEWEIEAGVLTWQAALTNTDLPATLGKQAFVFSWDGFVPQNGSELFQWLQQMPDRVPIEAQSSQSALSEKVKNYIDAHFAEDLPIGQVAEELRYSWAFMTREFKKTYHLSPVEYRHRLRLFSAVRLLSMGNNVTNSCLSSGFTSVSQFNLLFKKYLGTNPLQYSSGVQARPAQESIRPITERQRSYKT